MKLRDNGKQPNFQGVELMGFPEPAKFRLVVAGPSDSGEIDFLDVGGPAVMEQPGVFNAAWFWSVEGGHTRGNIGGPPSSVAVAGPDGSTLGISCFPAHSAGKLDVAAAGVADAGHDGDPAMHATDTIDYEAVISGKVDIELPGEKVRTLEAGDLLVMAGVPHAWKNHYDEDCVFIAVTIGYRRGSDRP
ncbi:MAG: cupin domain-containing protein [Solirubrobacterales bacterium]